MFFKKQKAIETELDYTNIPKNIAFIMDGNGRFAKSRKMPVSYGHTKGVEIVESCIEVGRELGVEVMSFYAFSTENWKRSEEEINHLFKLLFKFYESKFKKMVKNEVRFNFIGTKENLPKELEELFLKMEAESAHCDKMICNLAFNYGGRQEIVDAANSAIADNQAKLTIESFENYLYTNGQPEVDLLIRTSGEYRISNFLLWQLAYAEFVFPECYWPEFDKDKLKDAILVYQNRNRRFGGRWKSDLLVEQVL